MSGNDGQLLCPACNDYTTASRSAGGVRIDQCHNCKGAWFDAGELQQAIGVGHRKLISSIAGVRRCPTCDVAMRPLNFPGTQVEIDCCPDCGGLWLDAGEFRRIRDEIGPLKKRKTMKPRTQSATDEDDIPGIKGALIRFINSSLANLTDISNRR